MGDRPPATTTWTAANQQHPMRERITIPAHLQEAFRARAPVRVQRPVNSGERAVHGGGGIRHIYDSERIIMQVDETVPVQCAGETKWALVISIGRRYGQWTVMLQRVGSPTPPPPPDGVQGTTDTTEVGNE